MGGGDSTADRGLLVLVVDALAGKVGGTALRDLKDDGRLGVAGSLKDGVDLAKGEGYDVLAPLLASSCGSRGSLA